MMLFFCRQCLNKLREFRLGVKYYTFHRKYVFPSIVFMADGKCSHGGIVDRFKGIVTIYALSKVYKIPFYINYTSPFDVNLVLYPCLYDWRISNNVLSNSFWGTKIIVAYSEYKNPYRVLAIHKNKQNHIYYGYNSLELINSKFGTNYQWGELFKELFVPTKSMRAHIDGYKREIGGAYIAIHLRFVNLLGDDFKDVCFNTVYKLEEKLVLIQECRDMIQNILMKEKLGIVALVLSDSNIFIDYVKNDPSVFVIPGRILHVDNQKPNTDFEVMKPFIDFYLMSEAQKIISISNVDMYPSGFPQYAAKVNNVPFERIEL